MVQENDNEALLSAIAQTPVSVMIWARSNKSLKLYTTGVLNNCGGVPKDKTNVHAVLAVGYGTTDAKSTFLLKTRGAQIGGIRDMVEFCKQMVKVCVA